MTKEHFQIKLCLYSCLDIGFYNCIRDFRIFHLYYLITLIMWQYIRIKHPLIFIYIYILYNIWLDITIASNIINDNNNTINEHKENGVYVHKNSSYLYLYFIFL